MKPLELHRNGDASSVTSGGSRSDSSSDEEGGELSLRDPQQPARALQALDALRKARQHYDVLLVARGAELPAHRALLAALSPVLLARLPAAPPAAPDCLALDLDPDALRALLDYAYTGLLRVPDPRAARRLYRAAAHLRVEPVRAHLAARLLARLSPHDCLSLRALPDLSAEHRAALDAFIARHFDEVWGSGELAALPLVRLELLRETSAEGCEETAATLAGAALGWLRAAPADLPELAARTHLLYVDAGGALRDCGELPAARGDAPDLEEYKREARERQREGGGRRAAAGAGEEAAVVAARGEAGGAVGGAAVARAVVWVRGALAAVRVAWRAASASDTPRGGRLGAAADDDQPPDDEEGGRVVRMSTGRCAVGAAALGGRLVVCGGYERARVLRSVEALEPRAPAWAALPALRRARARCPAARLGRALYLLGGSDGYTELDSVDVFDGARWAAAAPLPVARQYAAAAASEARGELFVVGGSGGGRSLRAVHRYRPAEDAWSDAPPLATARSQCGAAVWAGALWALGGCDEWRCLASTERLALGEGGEGGWAAGPALPSARRSVGAAVWRGLLVAAGGSAGAASLRGTALLAAGGAAWREGPALRRARAAPALVSLGEALVAAGGYSGKEFLSCAEYLLQPDGAWTTLREGVPLPPAPTDPVDPGDLVDSRDSVDPSSPSDPVDSRDPVDYSNPSDPDDPHDLSAVH